jgi:ribose transport system substrate-binding protein
MTRHKSLSWLAWSGAALLLFSACSAAAPSAAPTVAPTAAESAAPTAAESAAPTVAESATPAAATPVPAWLSAASTTKVAAVAGGPHPFFTPWGPGTDDAVKALKLAGGIYKFPPQWELTAQNNLVETLVAQGYNAFTIFPGDANGTNTLLQELKGKSIPSIAAGGCTNTPSPAAFCIATDVYNSVYLGTKALIAAMGSACTTATPCGIVHVASRLVDPNTQARIKGVEKAVAESNGTVYVYQHMTDSDDQQAATTNVGALLAAHGADIQGIVSDAYVGSSVTATLLHNGNFTKIKFVGIDDDPAVLDGIKGGWVVGTMSQNPYGQAYISADVLDLLRRGCTVKTGAPFLVDSGTFLITKDGANVGDVPSTPIADYLQKRVDITNQLLSTFQAQYLTCPS